MLTLTQLDAGILTFLLLAYHVLRGSSGDKGEETYKRLQNTNASSTPQAPPELFSVIWLVLNTIIPTAFWALTRNPEFLRYQSLWLVTIIIHALYFVSNYSWSIAFDDWDRKKMTKIVFASLAFMGYLAVVASIALSWETKFETIFAVISFWAAFLWHVVAVIFTLRLPSNS